MTPSRELRITVGADGMLELYAAGERAAREQMDLPTKPYGLEDFLTRVRASIDDAYDDLRREARRRIVPTSALVVVAEALAQQSVARRSTTIARLAGVERADALTALERLLDLGKAERDPETGCWAWVRGETIRPGELERGPRDA